MLNVKNNLKFFTQGGAKSTISLGPISTILHSVGSTIPYEDELRAMFRAIESPVCLIRAKQGVPYPENIFQERIQSIKNLAIHEVQGGHHVHMDDPFPVAKIISHFLSI